MAAVATRPMRSFAMSPPPTPNSETLGPAQSFKVATGGKGGSLEELLRDEVKYEVMPGGLGSSGFDKYENQLAQPIAPKKTPLPKSSPFAAAVEPATSPTAKAHSRASQTLFDGTLNPSWPAEGRFKGAGKGLRNVGNTCFLNSVMQVMLHTPGLLRIAATHQKTDCRQAATKGWCMLCSYKAMIEWSFGTKTPNSAYGPSVITNNLQRIAKHLRIGRQEDAQEFFRFATDAFQASALAGRGKLPMPIQETTWVYALWGGKLLSRVTCMQCGANSDTYDSYLDLSVDVGKAASVKDALENFVAIDHLRGSNKYKCEKCKKLVNAEKRFLLAEAPPVLTIHLKRFKPGGGKVTRPIHYSPSLDISKYMVTKQAGLTYELFGVTCHSGGGPHSGHYYSFVKSGNGTWSEANDSDVSKVSEHSVLNHKNAYLLSYVRSRGSALANAINAPSQSQKAPSVTKPFVRENAQASSSKVVPPLSPSASISSPLARPSHPSPGAMQKRKREESEELEEESEHFQVKVPRAVSESPRKRRKDKRAHERANFAVSSGGHPHQKDRKGHKNKAPNPFGFVGQQQRQQKKGMVQRMKRR